jgi:FxsC-like protein
MADYYNFFFSFASADWKKGKKDDLAVVFRDIQSKLREFGLEGRGFFAPDTIERGSEWEKVLRSALPASSVLVPIYSPNYFKSVWCGKEWEIFWRRQQDNRNRPPADVRGSDVILPVIWTAEFLELPARVKEVQYGHALSDTAAYAQKGLGYLMQAPRRFPGKYEEFVHQFGTELVKMIKAQGAAKMRHIPKLEDLDLPFPAQYKFGLSHVQFVFLAGRRDEMEGLRVRHDCYGSYEDRRDWRPCFPDVDEMVGDLARAAALGNGKAGYEFISPGNVADLIVALREANARNNVTAIVVDPWSLKLGMFKEFAEKFDAEFFPSSGVVVTWNEKDSETMAKLPILKNVINGHFRGRISRREYYKEEVTTPEQFREALIALFNRAQEQLLEAGQIPPVGPVNVMPQPLVHAGP